MTGNAIVVEQMPGTEVPPKGTCSGCYRDPKPDMKMVATGMWFDFEGQIVLCSDCITFLGSLVGLEPIAKAKTRASDVSRHVRREAKIKRANESVLDALGALHDLADDLGLLEAQAS
jgi:hypothetical protein